jgi:DNA polymerase I-like protein with 3'-5' exonuclease and polymerase domains
MRSDEGGTRSGRFSSSQPNLQQIPARNPLYGPAIRGLFLPEEGQEWLSGDYKSQEPRLLVHFANVLNAPGVAEIVRLYHENPLLDLHQVCADMCNTTKRHAKTINLGMTYGMGRGKLAAELGLTLIEADELFERYHTKFSFVQYTNNIASSAAERRGYVRTLLGRRSRFRFLDGRRQFTHKALNRIIQGSGADMNKRAIVSVFEETGQIPLLTVHDENNFSIESRDEAPRLVELMETALPISVPIKIDTGIGANWAEAH